MNFPILLPSLVPLGLTAINLLTWRPPRAVPKVGRVSALVPARNEEANIEACVRALLAEDFDEVVVCDDHSTDRTPQILAHLQQSDARLRVIRGRPLPTGFVGKPHACAQLAAVATGDRWVFVDADTILLPGALSRILGGMEHADLVTALPLQTTKTLGEKLILPLLHLTLMSWFPLALVRRSRNPKFVAAIGQVLAVTSEAYHRIGGFEAVIQEVVDDMAFVRRAKQKGVRVDFLDGTEIARCRMYTSGTEAWEGFSKNLFEGVGARSLAFLAVIAVYFASFVMPWVVWPWFPVEAVVGILANVLVRMAISWRFGLPWLAVPAHLVSMGAFFGIALNSWRWSVQGRIRWRGRVYASRSARGAG